MHEKAIKYGDVRKYAIRANDPTRYLCPILACVSGYGTIFPTLSKDISCSICVHRIQHEIFKLKDIKKENCRTAGLQFKRRKLDG